ncbi:hypothetical protein LAZ67_16000740 [Cordylochernes scorpioides]|uniref:asparaginase n=1 Tax=Cordylochernes scorpioides TaxID=51811 RepID=A0ABY6LDE5_9ARAC|nr:hypothetical protein LAZ67_16000740 [Cordylochernes scorpioides]
MLKNQDGVLIPKENVLTELLRKYPQLHDETYEIKSSFKEQNPLVLPFTGEPQRVLYKIIEYFPLLDSSNMSIDHWILIAEDIKRYYDDYDGFVILHGTDTMAYTASALSFMLENLGKTVIITGSQIPLFELRSDGRQNLLGSLIVAGTYVIPEVLIQFNNNLYRGNRTSKVKADALDAFTTPNFPAIANFGIQIQIDWKNVFPSQTLEKFRVHPTLSKNVGLLRLFPSLTVEVMRIFLSPPLEGIVLQTYGAGNGPTDRKDLLEELKKASDRGVIIVNCTQCIYGPVQSSTYATGSALLEAGVVPGSDMTPEAALTKLSYVLSKSEWSLATKKKMLQTNIRGELTEPVSDQKDAKNMVTNLPQMLINAFSERNQSLKDKLYPALLCRLVADGNLESLEIMRQIRPRGYLLHHGASVHIRDREQRTPLMVAVECDQHDNIRLLVRTGASLNVPKVTVGNMLCQAARNGNILRLESLALAGANPNEMDVTRRTALHAAVEAEEECVVKFLFSLGVKCCGLKDIYGHTPHDIAAILNYTTVGSLLDEYCTRQKKSTTT